MSAVELKDQGPPDFECLDAGPTGAAQPKDGEGKGPGPALYLGYLLAGTFLGFLFIVSEVVSWYRIQEMFRFQSFHMYGIIGMAVAVGAVSLQILKRGGRRSLSGDPIGTQPKEWGEGRIPGARYWIGGTFFGMGWALLGACPGPIFALLGSGITVMVVPLAGALLGTWTYAALRSRLPH
jgi:uncharacterized protein